MELENELDGITVLSLEQAVAAPYCSMLLAEAGARVIKVERPEGDFARGYDDGAKGDSAIFAWLNRGKESICLDFNNPGDICLLKNILKETDVLLSNLTPGVLERRGLSFNSIKHINRRIINCSVSGYGSNSALSQRKAYDFLIQGEAGLCSVTGTEEEPVRVGISITDISTGLTAFSAILRAIIQRSRTGEGVNIDLSMFDVLSEWMNMPLISHRYLEGSPKRMAMNHSFVAPYGAFETKDRKSILLSIQNEREWRIFCQEVLKNDDLVNNPKFSNNIKRYKNKIELYEILIKFFKTQSKDSLSKTLTKFKIAFSNLNSVADLSEHQLLKTKEVLVNNVIISVADIPLSNKVRELKVSPRLDQHHESIRKEFMNQ